MTFPIPLSIEPPSRPDPDHAAIVASGLSANLFLLNQMSTDEVWVSSDEED